MSRVEISRTQRDAACPQGPVNECVVTVRSSGVGIEGGEGDSFVDVYSHVDGVDVRVGDVQLVVKGQRVWLLQSHPPYPITRWSVLWEGDLE